jgi:hypothetical protein
VGSAFFRSIVFRRPIVAMQLSRLLPALVACVEGTRGQGAPPPGHEFILPGPADSKIRSQNVSGDALILILGRSPCPWLNALANHGFLPRNGRSITRELLEVGFSDSFNFAPGSLEAPTAAALTTASNADGSFNLIDTLKHNVALEHDGSLSRNDAFFSDNLLFNPDIWGSVVAQFTEETISIEAGARVRADRIAAAEAVNPQFNLSGGNLMGSFAEMGLIQLVFGDRVDGGANTLLTKVIFGKFVTLRQNVVQPTLFEYLGSMRG